MPSRRVRRGRFHESLATRLPFVGGLAAWFRSVADRRWGRVPIGLISLLPISLAIDLFDVADEVFLGPVGVGVSFFVESAFLLALTGSAVPAFAFAALDVVPFVDTIPWATILLVREIMRAWRGESDLRETRAAGAPVIDV